MLVPVLEVNVLFEEESREIPTPSETLEVIFWIIEFVVLKKYIPLRGWTEFKFLTVILLHLAQKISPASGAVVKSKT